MRFRQWVEQRVALIPRGKTTSQAWGVKRKPVPVSKVDWLRAVIEYVRSQEPDVPKENFYQAAMIIGVEKITKGILGPAQQAFQWLGSSSVGRFMVNLNNRFSDKGKSIVLDGEEKVKEVLSLIRDYPRILDKWL